MKSFRVPRYLEKYEDVVFDLEQPLDINPNDGQYQKREVMKIVADNTGETTPFDWYNAGLSVDFKVDKLVDHAALTLTDHNGIVNGSNTLIKKLSVTANGRQVYDCDYANHCVNIKNLLEYNPSYAKSVGTMNSSFLTHQDMQMKINTQNEMWNTHEMMLIMLLKEGQWWMVIMEIITKVLPQENYYWELLLKSIVKFLSTDIHFLKNFQTNFSPT